MLTTPVLYNIVFYKDSAFDSQITILKGNMWERINEV